MIRQYRRYHDFFTHDNISRTHDLSGADAKTGMTPLQKFATDPDGNAAGVKEALEHFVSAQSSLWHNASTADDIQLRKEKMLRNYAAWRCRDPADTGSNDFAEDRRSKYRQRRPYVTAFQIAKGEKALAEARGDSAQAEKFQQVVAVLRPLEELPTVTYDREETQRGLTRLGIVLSQIDEREIRQLLKLLSQFRSELERYILLRYLATRVLG
ncbi:unnamed protein product [Amoebophrya sp. A25]|nr:unnamed protein product [Amoebophrya sp. A25]|eukprot:GSA25T00011069001.1